MNEQEKKKKLETLPWQALFDLAIAKEISEDQIKGKDKSDIITKLLTVAMLSDSEIDDIVNDYIYGDRVTFTLWNFDRQLTEQNLASIYQLEGYVESFLRASSFRGLKILSVRNCQDRIEMLYVYSKEYAYIDEDGKSASVWEQHRGCLWIGISSTYLACISKHDKMTSCIIAFITEKIGIPLSQVNPPKKAVERCINQVAISRIVLQGTNGEKTIVSRSEGLTVEQQEEINRIKDGRFDTSGSYIAKITEDTDATVKYNVKKGSLGLYKHLSAPALFAWSKNAIDIILEEINNLKGKPAKEIYKELGIEIRWPYLSPSEKELAEWFLSQTIACLGKTEEIVFSIPQGVMTILHNQQLFTAIPKIYCEQCESYETPFCSECGKPLKCTNEGVLFCTCGAPIRIQCSEGHTNCRTDNWFIPTSKMTTMLRQNIHNAFKQDALDFDMCVMGNQLHIIHTNSFTADGIEISFDDIQCFSALPIHTSDTTKEFAARLGEKCNGTCSYSQIQKCTSDCTMGCLPKAFYSILPGFRPQPHKGLEYGDVSCSLETSYGSLEMKGIIKKNSKNTGRTKTLAQLTSQNLLSTSKEGQEIIRQFVEQGMSDARTDLIAVIAPQYFDNSLKGTLRFLAKKSNKKIVFIELDNIARVIEGNKCLSVLAK